ncbi:ABC transporter permease, partial [Kitasatospora purpeofusca]
MSTGTTGFAEPADTPAPARSSAPRLLRAAARRLLGAAAVLLGAATVAFAALQLVPGDPVTVMLGPGTAATPEVKAAIQEQYGLDRPVPVQYFTYLGHLFTGDLGESYQLQRPVADLIGDQLGPTVQLGAAALGLAVLLALLAAVGTAGRRPALRALSSLAELLAVSSPSYWIGILLLTAFSFQLRVFPVAGDDGFAAL